ncbi:hypothetical protein C8Q74DRAFT_1228406 [Fomes fomentarius]|nr:hypothetical protein C8Q74DRAFT_1228406 [Fomes fomentarius]
MSSTGSCLRIGLLKRSRRSLAVRSTSHSTQSLNWTRFKSLLLLCSVKLASEKGIEAVCSRAFQSSERNRSALVELLQQGLIKPTPYEVLPGGLKAVPAGLERLQNNQVSGIKLVVLPHEN